MKLQSIVKKVPKLPWYGAESISNEQFNFYRAYGLHAANNFLEIVEKFEQYLQITGHNTKTCSCDNCNFLRGINQVKV